MALYPKRPEGDSEAAAFKAWNRSDLEPLAGPRKPRLMHDAEQLHFENQSRVWRNYAARTALTIAERRRDD